MVNACYNYSCQFNKGIDNDTNSGSLQNWMVAPFYLDHTSADADADASITHSNTTMIDGDYMVDNSAWNFYFPMSVLMMMMISLLVS